MIYILSSISPFSSLALTINLKLPDSSEIPETCAEPDSVLVRLRPEGRSPAR